MNQLIINQSIINDPSIHNVLVLAKRAQRIGVRRAARGGMYHGRSRDGDERRHRHHVAPHVVACGGGRAAVETPVNKPLVAMLPAMPSAIPTPPESSRA